MNFLIKIKIIKSLKLTIIFIRVLHCGHSFFYFIFLIQFKILFYETGL